ncbi:Non-ribosomal peptide synthetase [Gnomoniopsis sp. IMI 355080]|nr:Non-ribosomal peptide synthetase [Gnomoniopsis sp. IMI 355080]
MAEDRAKAKRCSLPKIDTGSATPSVRQAEHANSKKEESKPGSSRPHTLQDQILNSVASSLSLSPNRLRESLSTDHDASAQSTGPISDSQPTMEDLTIQTKVLAGSKTLADMETKLIPASAHSMAASLVDPDADDTESEGESASQPEAEEQVEKEVVPDENDSPDDDFDMRSASIMIAPEKIHRASRMETARVKGRQDFDKHVRMPSADEPPPMPLVSFDKPGEVELFLGSEKAVSKVVVLKPRAGLFEDRMVACLTLGSISPTVPELPKVELIPPSQMFFAGTQIATIKQNLKDTKLVDEKAIPEVWIPLDSMPMVPETDNIDRRRLRTWVQNANQEIYERVRSLITDQPLSQPTSEMEKEVQRLVARVLQVPQEQVGLNFTFGQLGGDEATAMALVTNARIESIFLESHEILDSNNTLAHLATLATQRGGLAHKWNEDQSNVDVPEAPSAAFFDLSPMQKLYFHTKMGGDAALRSSTDGNYRFNSSLLFRVAKGLNINDISAATDAVVGHHAMLRARFAQVKGEWMQRITPKVEGSYSFMHYTISTNQQVESVVQTTQAMINVEEGPVFAVAHFQTTDGHQMIYLAAHHLVVDVVSWRLIINDMDELLQQGTLVSQRAMPFQKWTELQKMDSQMPSGGLPFQISPGDLEYWGLSDASNTYADANEASFSLSEELTSILETTCNQVLRTDSVDIYVAALMLSFAQTFPDRGVPDVWNQEVGRDLWSNDIDITETVGWFTTLCPLNQQLYASSDFIDVLRRLKDTRRAVPHRGAHYFASKFFDNNNSSAKTESSRSRSPHFLQIATQAWPIEILFSHAGEIKNLGRDNGVLEQMALPGRTIGSRISDIGPSVGRIALFEVNTTVDQGSAKIKFLYNRNSKHADMIKVWISNYEHLLLEAIGRLRYAEPELTLADIPQLWATGVTYEGVTKLNRSVVTELGLNGVNEIEAVFPVTPVQQTILVSQAKQLQYPAGHGAISGEDDEYSYMPNPSANGNPSACHIHTMYEFASPDGTPVDLTRIVSAWDQVVARHQALRTVFIDSVAEQGLYNAVVLRRWNPNMLFLDATPSEDPADTLNNLPPLTANPGLKSVPRHRLTVCQSPMKTVVKLDVSAALCDMMSVNTLIADLKRVYATGRALPVTPGDSAVFSYSGYLDIMRGLDRERSIEWWRATLATVTQPCLFPRLDFYNYGGDAKERSRRYDHVRTELPVAAHDITQFCRVHKTTTGTILRLAWGMVLRAITGMNDVCFGYRAPGRSATLEGMRTAAGCFANTIAVCIDLSAYKPLGVLLRQIEDGYNAALPHQHITMAEVRHALATGGRRGAGIDLQLFNTCFAFTEEPADLASRFSPQKNFELRNVMNHETTDYDMTINTRFSSATGRLVVDMGHSLLSETQAHNIANTLGRAISAILECPSPSEHIGALDLFSGRDYAQIATWTNPGPTETQQQRRLLHELIFDQSIARPDSKAVCAHDGDLTYIQVEALSHRLAHVLLEAGVTPKNNRRAAVPVILNKSKWAPIALLAVLKAGAAFVPVDADEMGFVSKIVEQLGPSCKVAIACPAAAEALENNSSSGPVPLFDRVVCLNDALMKRLEGEAPPPGQLLPPSKPEDIACVFFTPTSSRSVRGISFTHAALSTCFLAQGPAVGINNTTRVLQLSSFNVDVALSEVFTTLVHGGAMCIPTSRDRYNDYTGCVTRFSANWSYMTPLLSRKLNIELLPTLRTVVFRTRGLDEDTYEPWRGRKRVVMAYGAPDVCPLGISFLEIHGPHHLCAIGTPIAGSAWIVSGEDHRNLVPIGAVGEMVIEGPTLGKTFRTSSLASDEGKDLPDTPNSIDDANKSTNRASFTKGHKQHPSISTIHSDGDCVGKKRYYKTGHSVRYLEGGLMEYVSSKRDDLEINGRIVNLAALEQHIRRALGRGSDVMVEALAFKGERGRQPTLAAFLELGSSSSSDTDRAPVAAEEHSIDLANMSEDVRHRVYVAKQLVEKALLGKVPEFMIPKIFIPVRHLPTTYSLKVNRRKLQKVIKGLSRDQLIQLATVKNPPEHIQAVNGDRLMAMSGLEAKIRAIWAEALHIDEGTIASGDGFISLGGDEISAAKVMVQCRREKMPMTLAGLMRDVTLSEWCRGSAYCESIYAQPVVTPGQPVTSVQPGQAITTTDEGSETKSLDKALDSAIEAIQHQQHPLSHIQRTTTITSQISSAPTAVATPTPQAIDRAFIDETLADKLLMEPNLIRDVAEATSTQVRHIETAILTQGAPRLTSTSPHGTGPANINYFVFHFTAPSSTTSVSARRIEEVCHILASIHPILRTAFVTHVEGQMRKLYQVVLKTQNVDFKHIQRVQSWRLTPSIEKEIKKDRERLATEHELFARPLTKFLFLDAGKTSALIMRLSRAQYDDQTIALLVKDLKKLYDGGHNPPRRPGFADFVREAALAQVGDEAERYWRGLLEGAVPTQVVRHTKPPKLSNAVRTLRERVAVNTMAMGGLGLSFDTVLKAAWGMVLATIAGAPDVVFGEVVDGCHSRLQQHLGPSSVNRGGVLGPTSTVLPVRIRFADSPTSPMKLLECVAAQRASGVPYENLGMLDIVEKCTPWPYWTRLSTVVQHRADSELLMDGRAKPFRLGQALCKINVVESEIMDIPDFLVRSIIRDKSDELIAASTKAGDKAAAEKARMDFLDGDEQLEISVSFCEQRVPANLAQEVLNKVCAYVRLLTGVSIMQDVVPTAAHYSSLPKQVPLVSTIFGNSPTAGVGGVAFNNPFGGGTIQVNFAQLEAKMSSEQMTTIQATIEDAWRSTLDPRTLGVPEEHVTTAAFYDLWGSLIPAGHLADFITDIIPLRLTGDLAKNLFGNNLDGFVITMSEIVDNPTMLDQFQLIVRKAFGGEGRDRAYSVRNRTNSLPHSIKSSSNNSLSTGSGGGGALGRNSNSSSQTSLALSRTGTLHHGPSKLGGNGYSSSSNNGHTRARSNSTGNTEGSDSPAMNSAPVFPAHPAVSPPISTSRGPRKNSDASNTSSFHSSATTAVAMPSSASVVVTPATSVTTYTPPASMGGSNSSTSSPSELPGSAHYLQHPVAAAAIKHSASIRHADASPESPILGNAVNMTTSPPVVQTGFVAARKKSNFGIGSSLRRMASNALRPGQQNHNNNNNNANGHAQRGGVRQHTHTASNLSVSTLAPPNSSGSDMSSNYSHSRTGSRDREQQPVSMPPQPPVSPWMRVQSMAPQLPPFSPFTPVTEDVMQDAFSLNNDNTSSEEGQRTTGPSPDLSQWTTSRGTSPELLLQQQQIFVEENNNKAGMVVNVRETSLSPPLPVMGRISGTLTVDAHNGLYSREDIAAVTGTEVMGNGHLTAQGNLPDDGDSDDSDGEGTLRANQVQQLLANAPLRHDSPDPRRQLLLKQQQQHQQDASYPSPSPVTETFYMEDDEGSEAEDSEAADDAGFFQYDSYEEVDDNNNNNNNNNNDSNGTSPATPRPLTMIHSPQQNAPATFTSTSNDASSPPAPPPPSSSPKPKQSPRYSVFPRASIIGPPSPPPPVGAANVPAEKRLTMVNGFGNTTTTSTTNVQDFASLEAAEMDDVVSPLTPVERAMLYKQQGLGAQHHRGMSRLGLGGGGGGNYKSLNNISPMTPPSFYTVQGAEMGGFHAI